MRTVLAVVWLVGCAKQVEPAKPQPEPAPAASSGERPAAPAGNNTGNLRIQVPGPVDTVDITYTSAQVGTATTQAISLSNITWTC